MEKMHSRKKKSVLNIDKSIGLVSLLVILFMYILPIFYYNSLGSTLEYPEVLMVPGYIYFLFMSILLRIFINKKINKFMESFNYRSFSFIKPDFWKKLYCTVAHSGFCSVSIILTMGITMSNFLFQATFTLLFILALCVRYVLFKTSIASIAYTKGLEDNKIYFFRNFSKVDILEVNQIERFEVKRLNSRKSYIHFHFITKKENASFFIRDVFSDSEFEKFLRYLRVVTNK